MVRIMKCSRVAFLAIFFAAASASAAYAQVDLSASFFESFNGTSAGNGTKQSTPDSEGGMAEARYFKGPLVGFGASYAYNHTSLTLSPNGTQCDYACANPKTTLSGKANEVAFTWVPSMKVGKIRVFGLGGFGFYIMSPGNSVPEVTTVVRPAFVVGGGADFALSAHLGIRVQYRDNIYKAGDPYPFS